MVWGEGVMLWFWIVRRLLYMYISREGARSAHIAIFPCGRPGRRRRIVGMLRKLKTSRCRGKVRGPKDFPAKSVSQQVLTRNETKQNKNKRNYTDLSTELVFSTVFTI